MIRIRTDDVLVHSKPFKGKEFERWKNIHLTIMEDPEHFYHTPAIVVNSIVDFPECVDYIDNQIAEGVIYPNLHGWDHIDYGKVSYDVISEHVELALEWFYKTWRVHPLRWVTPWGANTEDIQEACWVYGLELEDTRNPVIDQSEADKLVREVGNIEPLYGKVVMNHWFEKGNKLQRIIAIGKYGSLEEAKTAKPEIF